MPSDKPNGMKVQVEGNNRTGLVVNGKRRRPENKDAKYHPTERRMDKSMRKFPPPEDADLRSISATFQDGDKKHAADGTQETKEHRNQSRKRLLLHQEQWCMINLEAPILLERPDTTN
ncbi:hypothetical protein ZIOFF_067728 [Zingiber officinale]|uniref:SHSP domain-containing protein n=1 Tax=Zingiber officinale TaxID=94328 RepID=A0A8J5ESY1_ZINOF|nr:hypothetical protein ZIOFF_067728 [Zingiber officinale]